MEAATGPMAGWYDDPDKPGMRYWNGSHWTEHHAPPPPPPQNQAVVVDSGKDERNNTLAMVGYVFAILMPIVGAIIAIPLFARGDRRGTSVLLTAVVAFIVWFLILASSASTGTSTY